MAVYISYVEWALPDGLPAGEESWMPTVGLRATNAGVAWQMVDVRPDRNAAAGHVFVWVDDDAVRTDPQFLYLGANPQAVVTDTARAAIANRYGINIPQGTTVRELVRFYRGHYGTTPDPFS